MLKESLYICRCLRIWLFSGSVGYFDSKEFDEPASYLFKICIQKAKVQFMKLVATEELGHQMMQHRSKQVIWFVVWQS